MKDYTTEAVLAVERALPEEAREKILARFRTTNLNGAAVADILDILDNHDALLEFREPFYEDGGADAVMGVLGWDPGSRLHLRLVSVAVLAVALLNDAVPGQSAVAGLAHRAEHEVSS